MDANGVTEANRLYWETDTSVADIADRYDLSRRAFYEVIEPAPAGTTCPTCGQALRYDNRSARRDRQATCPECGVRMAVDPGVETAPDAMLEPEASVREVRGDGRAVADPADARTADLRGRAVLLGGAAIAGVALGTVAALLARRRD